MELFWLVLVFIGIVIGSTLMSHRDQGDVVERARARSLYSDSTLKWRRDSREAKVAQVANCMNEMRAFFKTDPDRRFSEKEIANWTRDLDSEED